ncbi:uncharacterized protein Bfra_011991 [Botrytis fragariae]|uniref:Uncharacterized protein n=1 Tax=Botrytis fragariae TaxID=1964551 RepID=A0A8H6EE62_9HELO|nr:uncharacterized protein Bfra_011991 [Botrytis fragariae]KAF5869024.1 hypothetical protein Bfra_011991 [Botrytis fragariae]
MEFLLAMDLKSLALAQTTFLVSYLPMVASCMMPTTSQRCHQERIHWSPASGRSSNYTAGFLSRWSTAAIARNKRFLTFARGRADAISNYNTSDALFDDDEKFIIPDSNYLGPNNKLIYQDTSLLSHTTYPQPLILNNGTVSTQIIHTFRVVSGFNIASFFDGALKTTICRYLRTFAIAVGADHKIKADGIDGIQWSSSHTFSINAIECQGPIECREGAEHTISPCTDCETYSGQYNNTIKNAFNHQTAWLEKADSPNFKCNNHDLVAIIYSMAFHSSMLEFGVYWFGKDAAKVFGWDPLYQAVLDTGSPRCFADEMASWWLEPSSVTISLGPTFNCPAAYSTVATSVHSAGVTQVFCCPTDYNLSVLIPSHSYGDYPTQCMSTLTAGDILKYQTATGGIFQPTSLTVGSTLLVHGEHINGWNIDDAVFASMIGSSQTATATATTTTTSSISTTSSTASSTNSVYTTTIRESGAMMTTKTSESATFSSPSSNSQSSSSPTPLTSPTPNNSTAIAAGVGIAAAVIILGIAAAVFLLIRRRKKRAHNVTQEIDSKEIYTSPPSFGRGPAANELSNEILPREMDGGVNVMKEYYAPKQNVHEI